MRVLRCFGLLPHKTLSLTTMLLVGPSGSGLPSPIGISLTPLPPHMTTKDYIPRRAPLKLFTHNTAHSSSDDCIHLDRSPNPEEDERIVLTNQPVYSRTDPTKDSQTISQNYSPMSDPYISALEDAYVEVFCVSLLTFVFVVLDLLLMFLLR